MKNIGLRISLFITLLIASFTLKSQSEGVSNPVRITFKSGEQPAENQTPRHNYALLIAIEEYKDPALVSLSEPIKDATKLEEVLVNQYTFDPADVTVLLNPTFEEIHVAFDGLTKKITPQDNLLIFYAGHGYFDDKTNIGYWLPADAENKNRAKWFRNSSLVENIGAINSKHTLLIADACFSGGIFKTRAAIDNADLDIANMMKRASRKALTSGSLTTVPDKSVFMKYVLKTLQENKNKYLSSEDVYDEVRMAMRNNASTKPQYGEIQNVGDEGGAFVLMRRD
jgi:Caspase domain